MSEGKQRQFKPAAEAENSYQPSPEYFARLLFLSFRYSQGEARLQTDLLDLIGIQNPEWRAIDTATFDDILTATHLMIENFFAHHAKKHPKNDQGEEVDERSIQDGLGLPSSRLMEAIGKVHITKDRQKLLATITEKMIARDHRFLVEHKEGKRPRYTKSAAGSVTFDPYQSHICLYGFLQHPTGMKEFNKIFQDIREYLLTTTLPKETRDQLLAVLSVWNEHHPDRQIEVSLQ